MAKREPAYFISTESNSRRTSFSKEFLETVVEYSYDGIYITDGNAVTIMVNKSYESITGLRREDVLDQNMVDLVRDKVISASGTLVALEKREPVTLEQTFRTGKHAVITSTPIFNEDNEIVMVVTNVRDVTDLHELRQELEQTKARSLEYYSELVDLRRRVGKGGKLIAEDPAMKEVLRVAEKVADLETPILIEGETGTGKRDLARYIVSKSRRKKELFFEVNCYDFAEGMLEQELFGTDLNPASKNGMPGILEMADGGSVYLQGISEISADCQLRLARLLKSHRITRVGGTESKTVDVRILASTSRNIWNLVETRQFRGDLYYSLSLLPIRTLPLHSRKEDIIPLVTEMCIDINKKYRKKKRFSHEALQTLKHYPWDGNIPELRNVVESAMILSSSDIIGAEELPIHTGDTRQKCSDPAQNGTIDLQRILDDLELKYIRGAYQRYGNVRDAARSLCMEPSTFVRKRKKLEGRNGEA